MKKKILLFSLLSTYTFTQLYGLPTKGHTTKSSSLSTQESSAKKRNVAEWTITCYMQAYNNLESLVEDSLNEIQTIGSTKDVNILVHLSSPSNKKSTRYLIAKGKKIELQSFNWSKGGTLEKELIDMMKWSSTNYPAKKNMMILWNRGYGLFNITREIDQQLTGGWLQAPGGNDLDIFYEDPKYTCLDPQGLMRICTQIKAMLGKNIDVVSMDTSMMATIEVAHDLKNSVNILLASQEIIPSKGMPYATFLKQLTLKPSIFGEQELTKTMINAYAYAYQKNYSYTLSAIAVNKINQINKTLNTVISEITNCYQINAEETIKLLNEARDSAVEFHIKDYIDLHSFYGALINQSRKSVEKNMNLERLESVLITAQKALIDAISKNQTGSTHAIARGISIYYPKENSINEKYHESSFAQNTDWVALLKLAGKA